MGEARVFRKIVVAPKTSQNHGFETRPMIYALEF
jgi:hypothetical protein